MLARMSAVCGTNRYVTFWHLSAVVRYAIGFRRALRWGREPPGLPCPRSGSAPGRRGGGAARGRGGGGRGADRGAGAPPARGDRDRRGASRACRAAAGALGSPFPLSPSPFPVSQSPVARAPVEPPVIQPALGRGEHPLREALRVPQRVGEARGLGAGVVGPMEDFGFQRER